MPKYFDSVEERRAYWREWYQRNKHREDYKAADRATKKRLRKVRTDWLTEYKKTLKCEHCGNDDERVLDFHHRDPNEKDFNVADVGKISSLTKLQEEVAKCMCLCSNCHRIEHWKLKNERKYNENK